MKIVAFIPYWFGYKNNDNTCNMKKLSGRYLINYSLDQIKSSELIDEIIIYSSDEHILDFIEEIDDVTYLKRPNYLDAMEITIEQIIKEFLNTTDADIVVLAHPNSPFLTSDTITKCIEKVKNDRYDSGFVALKFNKLAWFNNEPLNYSLDKKTPTREEMEPVILELSSLYVFEKNLFLDKGRRVGNKPFIMNVSHFEGHDVNTQADFEIAELIVNSGMYPKV